MASFLLLILACSVSWCHGYVFNVGGKSGWTLKPSENYNKWAERNRFQVNDTLEFDYLKGEDSVLLVTEADYNACNTTRPITNLTDGHSVFKFQRSGPFFFISGKEENCRKGQKLVIVVLAVRRPQMIPPTVAPASHAAPVSTPAPAPTLARASPSPSPSPSSPPPKSLISPASSPRTSSPSPVPSPLSSPALSPTGQQPSSAPTSVAVPSPISSLGPSAEQVAPASTPSAAPSSVSLINGVSDAMVILASAVIIISLL